MRGGQVGEGVEVAVEGIYLVLDRGEVNGNCDVDVGHLSGDAADGVEDDGCYGWRRRGRGFGRKGEQGERRELNRRKWME